MEEIDKKEKVQILADKLISTIPILDMFMESLSDEDFELLDECRDSLKDKININNSAQALIGACGGYYDDTEDRMKLKTLDLLVDFIKTRKEYRDKMIELKERKSKQQEVLKLFGMLGM